MDTMSIQQSTVSAKTRRDRARGLALILFVTGVMGIVIHAFTNPTGVDFAFFVGMTTFMAAIAVYTAAENVYERATHQELPDELATRRLLHMGS